MLDAILTEIDALLKDANATRAEHLKARRFVDATASAIRITALEDARRIVAKDAINTTTTTSTSN